MTGVCQKNMYLASGLQILIIGKAGLQIPLDGGWFSTTSAGLYASFACFNAGIGGSYSYSFKTEMGFWSWNANLGIGLGGSYNSSFGLNLSYGSQGFNIGFGGTYNPWAQPPTYNNPNATSDALALLSNATQDIKERLKQDMPLLTVDNMVNIDYDGGILAEINVTTKRGNGYNVNAAVSWLEKHAYSTHAEAEATKNAGKCAYFVRMALEAGGINTAQHPIAAREYGSYLERWGFRPINVDTYQKGDIAVFQGYPGGKADKNGIPYGHIQMYNGKQWLSYWYQRSIWPGKDYFKYKPSYQLFRW